MCGTTTPLHPDPQLGEHMSDNTITAGQLQPLVLRLLAGPIPHTTHRLVALVLLDTLVRYCRLLEVGRVSQLVGVFLGPLGIGHPASSVCSRAYYLFNRVVKALKEVCVARVSIGTLLRVIDHTNTYYTQIRPRLSHPPMHIGLAAPCAPNHLPAATPARSTGSIPTHPTPLHCPPGPPSGRPTLRLRGSRAAAGH